MRSKECHITCIKQSTCVLTNLCVSLTFLLRASWFLRGEDVLVVNTRIRLLEDHLRKRRRD